MSLIDFANDITTGWKSILMPLAIKHNVTFCTQYEALKSKYGNDLAIFPEQHMIFAAFQHFEPAMLKVVIIGQDPYHSLDTKLDIPHANGLAFSVQQGCVVPPSLKNIFKEIERCYSKPRTISDLTDWAKQGVLLLNTSLTVQESLPASHVALWKPFIQDVLAYVYSNTRNIVYMLWGNHAIQMGANVDTTQNLVLTHTHPSPLSRKPFTGNNHFVLCNEYLKNNGHTAITWV
jgi:uracil-DNA glycosylase